jgi:hypothetical protein
MDRHLDGQTDIQTDKLISYLNCNVNVYVMYIHFTFRLPNWNFKYKYSLKLCLYFRNFVKDAVSFLF